MSYNCHMAFLKRFRNLLAKQIVQAIESKQEEEEKKHSKTIS
jgi:hypothetical protein